MGTIYNVPITWVKDSGSKYTESYTGTLKLIYPSGNTINATWGNFTGQGTTKYDETTLYWNFFEVGATLKQDEVQKYVEDHESGKYYPNGRVYHYAINLAEKLILAKVYTLRLRDNQSMYEIGTMTKPTTIPLDVASVVVDKPTNFSTVGSEIFNNITVKYEMASTNKVDYQVIQDGKTLINKTNHTGKQFVIPYGTLKTTSTVTIKVRTHFNFIGTEQYSDWVNYSINGLKALTAEKPANVRIVGTQKAIEENITFAWDTADSTCRAITEIWQDGTKVTELGNISNKQYVLKAGTLKSTSAIKVRVKNTLTKNGYTAVSAYTELGVNNLVSIKPVVSDFVIGANNADHPINVTITAINATSYEVYKGSTKLVSGSTNVLTIPSGSLTKGNNAIKVVALRKSGAGTLKGELTKIFSITQDEPIIYAVEPSNINVNIEGLSIVSFSTNAFIDRWELYVNGRSFITGTVEREIPITRGTFRAGTNTLKVVAYYSPKHNSGQVRTVQKEVTFTGYGKPLNPIFDANMVYNSGTPTFKWINGTSENDRQVAFEISVHNESKIVNSSDPTYTVNNPLENNKTYTVKLRIKNKFEMWSDWVVNEFSTLFSELPQPIVTLSAQRESVLILMECESVPNFKEVVVYRSTDKLNWIEISNTLYTTDNIIDYMVAGGVETFYKARLFDKAGGYNDSEIKSITTKLLNYHLLDVNDLQNNRQLDFVAINFVNNFTSVTKIFAGATKPRFYKGKDNFLTANMVVKLVNEEVDNLIEYISKGDIYCYRDYKGKKLFVSIDMTAINYINPFMQEVILNVTEVDFNENLACNKSNYATVVDLDGSYSLDGSIDLSGWRMDV